MNSVLAWSAKLFASITADRTWLQKHTHDTAWINIRKLKALKALENYYNSLNQDSNEKVTWTGITQKQKHKSIISA